MATTLREKVVVCNQKGLHARASAKFCETATAFDAEVMVEKDGFSVRGDSVLDLC